jgi:hypothetical protein
MTYPSDLIPTTSRNWRHTSNAGIRPGRFGFTIPRPSISATGTNPIASSRRCCSITSRRQAIACCMPVLRPFLGVRRGAPGWNVVNTNRGRMQTSAVVLRSPVVTARRSIRPTTLDLLRFLDRVRRGIPVPSVGMGQMGRRRYSGENS